MNLYQLHLIGEKYKGEEWDVYTGFVIASKTPKEARMLANKNSGFEQDHNLETGKNLNYGEKNNIWLNSKFSKIKKIGVASKGIKAGIILESFHAG